MLIPRVNMHRWLPDALSPDSALLIQRPDLEHPHEVAIAGLAVQAVQDDLAFGAAVLVLFTPGLGGQWRALKWWLSGDVHAIGFKECVEREGGSGFALAVSAVAGIDDDGWAGEGVGCGAAVAVAGIRFWHFDDDVECYEEAVLMCWV